VSRKYPGKAATLEAAGCVPLNQAARELNVDYHALKGWARAGLIRTVEVEHGGHTWQGIDRTHLDELKIKTGLWRKAGLP